MCWGEGFPPDSGAHNRIQELEGQVHTLTARASVTGTFAAGLIQSVDMCVLQTHQPTNSGEKFYTQGAD
jgi:hypothetical protein